MKMNQEQSNAFYAKFLQVGDRVVMTKSDEDQSFLENNVPKGTIGIIKAKVRKLKYCERFGPQMMFNEQGQYEIDSNTMIVQWEGHDYTTDFEYEATPGRIFNTDVLITNPKYSHCVVSGAHCKMIDQEELSRRYSEKWYIPVIQRCSVQANVQDDILAEEVRIGDLPETECWEWDHIRWKYEPNMNEQFLEEGWTPRVQRILYNWIDRTPYTYMISWFDKDGNSNGGTVYASPDEIEVVERGKVWWFYHNVDETQMEFHSLMEEVNLHWGLGLVNEVHNPTINTFNFNLKDAREALEKKWADGFMNNPPWEYDTGRYGWHMIKFVNQSLSERVNAETMARSFSPTTVN